MREDGRSLRERHTEFVAVLDGQDGIAELRMAQVEVELRQPITAGHFRAIARFANAKERLQQFLLLVRPKLSDEGRSEKTLQGAGSFEIAVTQLIRRIRIRWDIGQALRIKI